MNVVRSREMNTLKKVVFFISIILLGFFGIQLFALFHKTDYCNCVVVSDESDFNGEWLKHKKSTSFSVRKTDECILLDDNLDKGDGSKTGKVRWAECLSGPDCDEAGLF